MSRLSLSALSLLFLWCGISAGEDGSGVATGGGTAKAAVEPLPPENQGRLELELLRAPARVVARVLLEEGEAGKDVALRERLLMEGATKAGVSRVEGPYGKRLQTGEMKITKEPRLFEYAEHWQNQAQERKEGKPLSPMDAEGTEHKEGTTLTATLEETDAGTQAEIRFEKAEPPGVRQVNTWPVKDRIAKVIQDRQWVAVTEWTATGGGYRLVAMAPEPPLADGSASGFVYAAFAKVTASKRTQPISEKSAPQATQCWSFELPAETARQWLATRKGTAGDEKQLRRLLADDTAKSSASVIAGVYALRRDSRDPGFVHSGLEWMEALGFEAPDTRYAPFIPVPNDTHSAGVVHQLAIEEKHGHLTLPGGPVRWQKWHGGTRGAVDEPAGVESSGTGSAEMEFPARRESGRVFLTNAHTRGTKMRLTFVRSFFSTGDLFAGTDNTIQILETPAGPWLPRLTTGEPLTTFTPDLITAVADGSASVIHTESYTFESSWNQETTWPWVAIAVDYIIPSILNGKFFFTPRSLTRSSPAWKLETNCSGTFAASLCGEPANRKFGLWLPEMPGYSAETSTISFSEWPQLEMSIGAPAQGADSVLHASLGRSWKNPEQAAIHWVMYRSVDTPRAGFSLPAEARPSASFTVTGSDGAVLAWAALPATGASMGDGRTLQSLEPRPAGPEQYFQEAVPANAPDGGKSMDGGPHISSAFDGMRVSLKEGRWTLEHSIEPARKITETLTLKTSNDAGGFESIPVSCERLVLRREKFTGMLPAPGGQTAQALDGGRTLTVRIR